MSNLLEQASLVLIPSGYKEDVVYSEIPLDGSGDMAFTRSSNGTRINSAGVIETKSTDVPRLTYQNGGGGCPSLLLEKQSTNLVTWSEDFTQTNWLKLANAVVSGTTVISPDGTQNANQVIYDGTTNCRVEQVIGGVTSGADYTFSVYMRVASGTASVEIGHGSSTVAQTVTTNWQRFIVTQIPISTTSYPRIMCNSAKTVEVWGAQLE